jgi:hypothetical protein
MNESLYCPRDGLALHTITKIRDIPYMACMANHKYAFIDGEWVPESEVLIESK